MWEVSWREINARFEFVIKRKAFKSSEARKKFCERLMEKESFDCLLGFRNPPEEVLVKID